MKRVKPEPGSDEASTLRALSALQAAAQTIASSVDLEIVAAHSLQATMTLLGARSGSLHVAAADGATLLRRAALNMPDELLPEAIDVMEVANWLGGTAPGILNLEGTETRPRQQAAWQFGIRRIFFVPLGEAARPIGLMALGLSETGPLHASLVDTLTALGRLQMAAIANASAHEQTRLATERLEQENRRFAATIEHLPVVIAILNRQGEVVRINQAARDFQHNFIGGDVRTSWTERAMQVASFSLDGKPIPMSNGRLARAFAGESLPGEEIRMLSPDRQREIYAIVSVLPIRRAADGTVEEVVAVNLDVTEQRALAEAKDRFLRIASHELRSPLTSLRATTGLLDPTAVEDPERRGHLIARVNRQVDRLTHLVDQLIDSARLHSKELPLQREAVGIDEICREALEYLGPEAQGRTITIATSGDLSGVWDRLRIEQIITNLVNNAVRHSDRAKPVEIGLRGDAEGVAITVSDRGIGVPEEQLGRLFTPFYRATNSPHRGGIGLGLYISSEIVRRHGGKISAERRPEGGMVFTVTLPKQPAEQR